MLSNQISVNTSFAFSKFFLQLRINCFAIIIVMSTKMVVGQNKTSQIVWQRTILCSIALNTDWLDRWIRTIRTLRLWVSMMSIEKVSVFGKWGIHIKFAVDRYNFVIDIFSFNEYASDFCLIGSSFGLFSSHWMLDNL